jgi:hypothetical protein
MQSSAYLRLILIGSCDDRGFSLVETMVAALVMILLVVYAEMFRLKAKQSSDSRAWIQQDLENVKFKASQFSVASLSSAVPASTTSITVNQTSIGSISLATGDTLKIGTDSVLHTISSISGTILSFTPSLGTSQSSGAPVWVSGSSASPKFCNASSSATGLAQALLTSLDPVTTSSKTISGVSYVLSRVATPSPTAPYQLLTLAYSVVPTSGRTAILSLQTEVMPNAAFGCP